MKFIRYLKAIFSKPSLFLCQSGLSYPFGYIHKIVTYNLFLIIFLNLFMNYVYFNQFNTHDFLFINFNFIKYNFQFFLKLIQVLYLFFDHQFLDYN